MQYLTLEYCAAVNGKQEAHLRQDLGAEGGARDVQQVVAEGVWLFAVIHCHCL